MSPLLRARAGVLVAAIATALLTACGGGGDDLVVERDGSTVIGSDSIGPGESTRLTVDLEAGHYVFYCSIGDHRAIGMETDVTVT